jgi:hypothetical protein
LQAVHDSRRYKAMGAADINALLGVEKMKDAVGCTDASCLAEIGGALGAQFVLSGQLGVLSNEVVLSARLLDAKKNDVLERGSARGGGDAATLAKMMASVMSEILHVEVKAPASLGGASVALSGVDYSAYTDAVTALGKKMSSNDYSGLLVLLDKYEKTPPTAPKGQDFKELMTFYRVTACFMLVRPDCLKEQAAKYIAGWPDGLYRASIDNYTDRFADEQLKRDAGKAELKRRLAEIAEQAKKSHLDPVQEQEMIAWAYFSANEFLEAAARFAAMIPQASEESKYLDAASNGSMAYQRGGNLVAARSLLEAAEKKYPQSFRLRGMHQTLKTLPK